MSALDSCVYNMKNALKKNVVNLKLTDQKIDKNSKDKDIKEINHKFSFWMISCI